MKARLLERGKKWSFLGLTAAIMIYAATALTSRPAYATTCDESTLYQAAMEDCYYNHGGWVVDEYQYFSDPLHISYTCLFDPAGWPFWYAIRCP